jgi:hypothetical protein
VHQLNNPQIPTTADCEKVCVFLWSHYPIILMAIRTVSRNYRLYVMQQQAFMLTTFGTTKCYYIHLLFNWVEKMISPECKLSAPNYRKYLIAASSLSSSAHIEELSVALRL